jgi:hypothetical protein
MSRLLRSSVTYEEDASNPERSICRYVQEYAEGQEVHTRLLDMEIGRVVTTLRAKGYVVTFAGFRTIGTTRVKSYRVEEKTAVR